VPPSVLELLRTIYERLGGDEGALAGKRAGSSPRPDFTLASAALIVDVDEIQHFTSDRLATRRVGSVCHFARPQRDAQAFLSGTLTRHGLWPGPATLRSHRVCLCRCWPETCAYPPEAR
jgi:hypothetical protein